MLRRTVKIQLILFVLITLAGVSYVSAAYIGLFHGIGSSPCTVGAEFPQSGGIFSNAEVTYRGVTVGRVGELHLIGHGVRVDLELSDCSDPKIPLDTAAAVSDRSVIGEQYVNLVPPNDHGPYLSSGAIIPMSRSTVPVAPQQLLTHLDELVNSVDLPALRTAVSELGTAFSGRGQDLGALLASTDALLKSAQRNLPATVALIDSAAGVLQTQLDEQQPLAGFAHSLALLSRQLKASDGDIRGLLDDAPADLRVVEDFVRDNRTDLGSVLANLATTGETLERHVDGLTEILELYPVLAAGGQSALTAGGIGRLGFVLQPQLDPSDCGSPSQGGQGYGATVHRPPGDTAPNPPNLDAHCTAPLSSGINVRGSANVPGGDPTGTGDATTDQPRVTEDSVRVGDISGPATVLGDRSWIALLAAALD